MEKNTVNYWLYEGSIVTLAPVLDRSVNILMFRGPEGMEYNILVNRTWLDEDQTLEQFCEQQINTMRNSLPAFEMDGKLLTHEIGPARLPVVQVSNRFLQDGKKFKQVQSLIKLPWHAIRNPANRAIIMFTLSTETEFTEFQRKHYVQVINSFNPEATMLKNI
ncbi:DcrB-related protein [Atlantibacter sp. RC6]|uniref:DcrB-related protein n=1 Tax=Atlantibacter sp. RC6 TaxID=2587036 RepID=UPI001606056B|nr:DcrB-related protein [Atlantibacter sp. RC6]MBB3324723.1 hypothetical protein [Atlantibacter sp. RC6]